MARRNSPLQLLAALLALVCLMALATTAAGAKKGKGNGERGARAERWRHRTVQGGFRARIPKILSADSAPEQRRAYRAALKAAMRDARSVGVFGADHEQDDEFSISVPAGDLTGDGKDDAVEVFDTKIQGVRGTNGSTLWSRPFEDWGGYLGGGRLDGAPGDDVLVVEVHEEDRTVAFHWTIRLIALSGQSGNPIWTRTYENVWTIGGVGSSGLYVDVDFAIPFGLGETNGDGARDALMARFDFAEVASNVVSQSRALAVFETVSGANGQVVGSYPATGTNGGVPDAIVSPTFTGDAADDVVTSSVSQSGPVSSLTIEGFPGRGGAAAWRRPLTMTGRSWMEGLRLNGDTAADVLVGSRDYWAAINGANGSELWSDGTYLRAWIQPAGDANGDGGQDLIVIRDASVGFFGVGHGDAARAAKPKKALRIPDLPGHGSTPASHTCYGYGYGYCPPPVPTPCDGGYGYGSTGVEPYGYGYGGGGCPAVEISLVRGSNGAPLWDTYSFGWAEPADDTTGDGVGDVLVDGFTLEETAEGEEPEFAATTSIISGKDGETAWSAPTLEDGFLTSFGADIDGDEADDLLELNFGQFDSYRPVSGRTGEPLWDGLVELEGWLFTVHSASLDGQGRDIIDVVFDPWSWGTSTTARDGAEGSMLWHR